MVKSFDVCIRGDGIVGRTLALLLARARLRVALIVPDAPAQPTPTDIRAYALNQASFQTLQSVGAWPQAAAVTPVTQMRVWGDDGGYLDFTAPATHKTAGANAVDTGPSPLAWIVDVALLEQTLQEALRFQPDVQTIAATDPVKAPLTVVCEGKASASRLALGVHWTVKPYPQKALAARLHSELPHQGIARQWFVDGQVVALLPMGGATGHTWALVWSAPQPQAEALEHMPAADFVQALAHICGHQTGALTLTSQVLGWPLSLSRADRWVGPGWALAGDAAHTVHPLAGQGLNLGLADAQELTQVLSTRESWRALGDEKLLRRYERARKTDLAVMAGVSDGLHGLFAQTDARWQFLRNWGMKGVARSGPLKSWLVRQATGLSKKATL